MSEKKNLQKKSNILWIIMAVAIVAYFAYALLTDDFEHIEDTNGPDNYALATITDENIIKQDLGSLNVKRSSGILHDGITFSSGMFSGVYEVFTTNFLLNSDFTMDLTNFYINGGNFKMALVNEDKIVATVEPDMFASVELHDLNGSFSLVIAGESADFEFTLDGWFCEQYGIEIGK